MSESFASIVTLIAFTAGLFYAAGGVVHMRALVMDAMADGLLTMLGDGDAGKERRRTRIMTLGAALTFASGLSLVAMSRWTLPIFAVNAALQGAYLLWAARAFPPQNDNERRGRRSTVRAFLIYLVALGFVVALDRLGLWRIWFEPALVELAIIVVSAIAVSWFFRRGLRAPSEGAAPMHAPAPEAHAPAPQAEAQVSLPPERLRLAPEYHCSPLWDDERGNMLLPGDLALSPELVARIDAWDDEFQATYREDNPLGAVFPSVAAERAWVREGYAIAGDLGREWPGPLSVQISALDMLMRDARHDLSPLTPMPEDRGQWIGELCGVAEIEAAIERLDALSRERDELPDWDGDSRDDIARTQELFQRILAHVPARYIEDVAAGLESPQWGTRVYVAGALAGHERAIALPILRHALAREKNETARQLIAMTLANAESEGR